jgi:biotin carboxylase
VSYNLLRSLAHQGLRVGLGGGLRSGTAAYSRYCAGSFRHPSYDHDPRGFMAAIREVLIARQPAVCMPADEDIFVFAEYAEILRDLPVRMAVAPSATLRRLDNKYESVKLAGSLGIPVPATIRPANVEEIAAFAREHPGPLIMKLVRSSASRGLYVLQPERLRETVPGILEKSGTSFGDFIVQERIQGTGYGVSMLFDHGQLKASFTHRRLRELSPAGGPSTLRQSIRQPELEAHAGLLLRHVGYHGVAMVEFKHDEVSGKVWFLEVNPRWWGSLALAVRAGVDFPYLYYRMALGENLPPPPEYRTGVTVRWLLGDLLALKNQFVATRKMPGYRDLFPKVDGYDYLFADDPLPFAAELVLRPVRAVLAKSGERRKPLQ